MNLNQQLLRSVAAGPERTAIVDGKTTVSYGELAALAVAAGRLVDRITEKPHMSVEADLAEILSKAGKS